ncbi:MAG TPA: hypothetical protein VNS58_15970 [Puia sp.]|nr:hypothetical protein [Puia sp.]
MENGIEHIEAYFGKEVSAEESRRFEQAILEDPAFAEEVAFYLSAKQAARDLAEVEKKERFLQLYRQEAPSRPVRTMARAGWVAIAAVVFGALLFSWYLYQKPAAPGKLANRYIEQHWQTLGVSMSSREDSIQTGLRLYNEGKWPEALKQFEIMIRSGNTGPAIKKYAGIVTLRLKDYDKALLYFKQLAAYPLYANPGLFYQALTLMERNQSGDSENAKQLLQQIVKNDLEEKETALEWLRKL